MRFWDVTPPPHLLQGGWLWAFLALIAAVLIVVAVLAVRGAVRGMKRWKQWNDEVQSDRTESQDDQQNKE